MRTDYCRNATNLRRPFDLREFYVRLAAALGLGNDIIGDTPCRLAWDMDLPETSLNPDEFRARYLWAEIASKYDPGKDRPQGVPSQQERKAEALKQFRLSEERCAASNLNLRSLAYRHFIRKDEVTLDAVILTAAVKIGQLLGPFSWESCDTYMGFGPGASFYLPRRNAYKWTKFEADRLDVQPPAVPVALAVLAGRPLFTRALIEAGACLIPNAKNRVTTVPKNYKRDRVIAVEPLMGSYIQKGIGGAIRKRLKRVGINLDDQRANQLGALIGSLNGELATIDLKAASDTISREIVAQLLPPDWYAALEQCRSLVGVLDSGETVLYRKFSSMGNGYTFELETLIFWGICSAVLSLFNAEDRRLLVYGDDIIVPSKHAEAVLGFLQGCGFEPNLKKTHMTGRFRESCGKHYLDGFDVTPFYIRRPIKTPEELWLLHNNLMRWSCRGYVVDAPYRARRNGLDDVLSWVRSHAWCSSPTLCDGYGDNGFIGSFDEVRPTVMVGSRARTAEGYVATHWPAVERVSRPPGSYGAVCASLDSLERAGTERFSRQVEYFPLSRRVLAKRSRKKLLVPLGMWQDMGPWV